MEHTKAQKRMLICAAFFSFGTLGGALTMSKLSADAAAGCCGVIADFFGKQPLLRFPLFALATPLLLLLAGSSPLGILLIGPVLALSGASCGFAVCGLIRMNLPSPVWLGFVLMYAVCLLQIGGCMLRRSSLVRMQIRCGGLLRPDYGFDASRVLCALALLFLAALSFAYYALYT